MPSNYDDLIAHENEHSGLDFKSVQYTRDRHEAFLTDVMAMANASVNGERLIFIGVKHRTDGSREYRSIPQDEFVDAATYQQLVHENIEPNLDIEYVPHRFAEALLGVLRITSAADPPYMLKKDFGRLRRGECIIRKGSHQHRASRDDLERFFRGTTAARFDRDLSLGFRGTEFARTLDYRIEVFSLPSERAKEQIEAALAAKRARAAHLGRQLSALDLLPARTLPYEHRSIEALEQNRRNVERDFEGHDLHAAFTHAFELNIELLNNAEEYLTDASLEVAIPQQTGLFIFEQFCDLPSDDPLSRLLPNDDYPDVETRNGDYCVRAHLGDLKHGIRAVAFREPLRIDVDDGLAGAQVTLRCSLFAKNLRTPLARDLILNVLPIGSVR